MKISIVTITRDYSAPLQRTIQSVAAQTCANIEHIVVSADEGEPPLWLSGTKVIYRAPRGVYDALNAGIAATTGNIVGILHAGDVFATKDVLATVSESFTNDTDVDFVYGDVLLARAGGSKAKPMKYRADRFEPKRLTYGIAPPHPSLYIRGDVARRDDMRYDPSYIIAGDFDLFVRLFLVHKMRGFYLPRPLVIMEPGGIATLWKSRLYTNPSEKLRSLRSNHISASPLRIIFGMMQKIFGHDYRQLKQ